MQRSSDSIATIAAALAKAQIPASLSICVDWIVAISWRTVAMRIAEHAGRIYLDLTDEHWRVVAIGAESWRVLGCPPVRFRRPPGHDATAHPGARWIRRILKPFLRCSPYRVSRARKDRSIESAQGARRSQCGSGQSPPNGHLLAFDNLSGLPPWLSDALCRIASGG